MVPSPLVSRARCIRASHIRSSCCVVRSCIALFNCMLHRCAVHWCSDRWRRRFGRVKRPSGSDVPRRSPRACVRVRACGRTCTSTNACLLRASSSGIGMGWERSAFWCVCLLDCTVLRSTALTDRRSIGSSRSSCKRARAPTRPRHWSAHTHTHAHAHTHTHARADTHTRTHAYTRTEKHFAGGPRGTHSCSCALTGDGGARGHACTVPRGGGGAHSDGGEA